MTNSMDKVQKRVSKNLKDLRCRANMTQIHLSLMLGVNNNYISLIERGAKMPSIKRLAKISEILKVDISEFFKQD